MKILGFKIQIEYDGFDFIKDYRVRKAIRYWNNNLSYIEQDSKEHKEDEHYHFRWVQLVWQELKMYCIMGKQVDPVELEKLSEWRGFSPEQKSFLITCLKHVGLGKKL